MSISFVKRARDPRDGRVPAAETAVCAVQRDTDLRRHSQLLHRLHDEMLGGDRAGGPTPSARPRMVVQRSWRRMRAAGPDVDLVRGFDPIPFEELEDRRRGSPLSLVIDGLQDSLVSIADAARHLLVVTDAGGLVLWRAGSEVVRRRADAVGFDDGVRWTESLVGTNAIGTALVEETPVQLFSAEHYIRGLHTWSCTAAPVHDPWTGALLGVVNLSAGAGDVHPQTVALVRTAVRWAEAELWRHRELGLNALRARAGALMAQVPGSAVLVDEDGWVAAADGVAAVGRLPVPSVEGGCIVPGWGHCIAERVTGGWLLRERGGPDDAGLTLELDVSGPPVAVLRRPGDVHTWRCPLTRRNAQLLALVYEAGPTGRTATQLSCALYGDAEHAIAVRAEISRLRRRLAGVLLTRPYRIAANVRVAGLTPPERQALFAAC